MNDNLLIAFVAVTAGAVVLQALILGALYLAVRKSTAKMEALAIEVKSKALPTMETVQSMLVEMRPQIAVITANATESSNLVRNQLGRIDATLTDALDPARSRGGGLVTEQEVPGGAELEGEARTERDDGAQAVR